jgi:hypothetical protein
MPSRQPRQTIAPTDTMHGSERRISVLGPETMRSATVAAAMQSEGVQADP